MIEYFKNYDLFKFGKYFGEKMKYILLISGVKIFVLVFCVVKVLKDDWWMVGVYGCFFFIENCCLSGVMNNNFIFLY